MKSSARLRALQGGSEVEKVEKVAEGAGGGGWVLAEVDGAELTIMMRERAADGRDAGKMRKKKGGKEGF